jgi:hypothetical protein
MKPMIVHVSSFVVFEWLNVSFSHVLQTEQALFFFHLTAKEDFLLAVFVQVGLFVFLDYPEAVLSRS